MHGKGCKTVVVVLSVLLGASGGLHVLTLRHTGNMSIEEAREIMSMAKTPEQQELMTAAFRRHAMFSIDAIKALAKTGNRFAIEALRAIEQDIR